MMMRKIILTALFSYTCFPLVSQLITYYNYLNYTSRWQYKLEYFGINGLNGYNEYNYIIVGDTLIEGIGYYKVREQIRGTELTPMPHVNVGSLHYVYALRETPDSLFIYRYPNGRVDSISQTPDGWTGRSVLDVAGQLPHRVYWSRYHPIQGWIEGIGLGQFGGQYPYELSTKYFVCYTRDSLSTKLYADTCIIADFLTSTEGPINDFKIALAPNPANDFVTILNADQIPGPYKIRLYTPDGRQVLAYEGTGEEPIDIHTLDDGIYFVCISLDKKRIISKLVVYR